MGCMLPYWRDQMPSFVLNLRGQRKCAVIPKGEMLQNKLLFRAEKYLGQRAFPRNPRGPVHSRIRACCRVCT